MDRGWNSLSVLAFSATAVTWGAGMRYIDLRGTRIVRTRDVSRDLVFLAGLIFFAHTNLVKLEKGK